MKKQLLKLLVTGTAVLLSGCFPATIHPFYTTDDLGYEPALIGRWSEPDDTDTSLQFAKAENGKGYDLTVTDGDDDQSRISAHLLKLDGTLYLDMMPLVSEDMPDFPKIYLLPVHWLYKVESVEPEFKMTNLDTDWLESLIKEAPETLKHEWVSYKVENNSLEERLIITASTKELQAFIIKHANNEDAWDDDSTKLVKTTSTPLRQK